MPQTESLRVFVRVRPPISKEIDKETAVHVGGTQSITLTAEKNEISCSYDFVFNELSTQDQVFERVKPLLSDVLAGINGCVFAYGQTSAGKSYTMLGPNGGQDILQSDSSRWGLIPRTASYLMDTLNDLADDGILSYEVKASFLQIYNENLYDLLRDSGKNFDGKSKTMKSSDDRKDELKIREIPRLNSRLRGSAPLDVFVSGLSEFRVMTSDDILRIVSIATNNRVTKATDFNFTSSRSHAILQLTFDIESREESGQTTIIRSKLNLVDLAGSEKIPFVMETNNAKHMKELTSINKSLSSLGNVIAALTAKSNRSHIPYRDSKLTRLLQDCLSGNTRTILIACVAPTKQHTSESLSTLQFADRAKSVMLTVQANTIVDDKHTLAKAQAEIQRLKGLLSRALKQVESHEDGGEKVGFAKLMAENEKLKQENKSLRIALAQFQQQQSTSVPSGGRNQSGGKRFSALGVLLEEDDLELSGEDYSQHKSEAGSQLSRHQSNSKKKHTGTRNLHRASAEANSSSADNVYTTHHSSSSSLDRSNDSSGHRSLKAASSSLHSLVTFSYFDQPQNKGTSSQSESERDDASTGSKRASKKSLPPMPLDGAGDSQQRQQSVLREEEQLQIQVYRQMKEQQEQAMMMRDSGSNVSHVNSKVHSKLLRAMNSEILAESKEHSFPQESPSSSSTPPFSNRREGVTPRVVAEVDVSQGNKETGSRKGKNQRNKHNDEATAPLRDCNPRPVGKEGEIAAQIRPSSQLSTLAAAMMPPSLAAMASATGSVVSRSQPLQSLSQPLQQSQQGTGLAVTLSHSRDDIGKTMQIFSFRKNTWEKLEVMDYEQSKRLYKCKHIDGTIQWLDLTKKPIREFPPEGQDDDES